MSISAKENEREKIILLLFLLITGQVSNRQQLGNAMLLFLDLLSIQSRRERKNNNLSLRTNNGLNTHPFFWGETQHLSYALIREIECE